MAEEKKAPPKKATAAKKPTAGKAVAKKPAPLGKKATSPNTAVSTHAKKATGKKIKVTQIGSPIGRQQYQRATLIGLGLNKMHRSRELIDTPAVRGMLESIPHLIKVEEAA